MNSMDEFFKAWNPKLYQERKEAGEIYKKKVVAIVDKAYSEEKERKRQNKIEEIV